MNTLLPTHTHTHPSAMAYNQLADRFRSMSEQRDRNENSQTEAHCYMSEEGYVQEVVSKSPARIRDENGELHQIVTRRRTVTAGPSNTSSEAGGGWDTGSTSSPGGRNGGGGLQRAPSATGSAYTAPRLAYGQVALPSTPATPDGGLYRGGSAAGGIAPAASSYNPPRSVSNYAASGLGGTNNNNNTTTTPLRNGGSEYVPKYRFGGEHDDDESSRNQNYASAVPFSSTPNAGRVGGGTIRSPSFVSPAPKNPGGGGGWGADAVGTTGESPSYFPAPYAASPVHEYQPQPQHQHHGSIAWVRNPNNSDAGAGGGENDEAPMSGGRYANYTSPLSAGPNSALRATSNNNNNNDDDNYTVITESRASVPGSRSSSVVNNQHSGGVYRSGSSVYNNNNPSRSVTITGVSGTTEIEPSRVSPIHVTTRYAPVKYVTRGELRRRQKEQEAIMNRRGQGMGGGGDNFASKIRYSSVPRLDSRMEEERISSGGNYYNNTNHNQTPHSPVTTWGGGGGGSSNRYRGGAEEDAYANQGPLPALSPGGSARYRSASNGPPRPYSSIPLDDDLESIASSAAGDQRRRQQQLLLSRQLAAQQQQLNHQRVFASEGRGGGGSDYYTNGGGASQERPYYRAPSSNGNGGRSPLRRSNSMHGYNRLGVHQDANNDFIDIGDGTGSVYSAAPSYMPPNHRKNYGPTTTAFDLPETGVEAIHVARFLAHIRSIPSDMVPPASQYVEAAFKLLTRGTYLIKYGRQGFPHERFFAVRMVPDERQYNGRTQPYLVWAVHGDSAVFKEKVHLGHLRGVTKGVASEGFTRSLVSPDIIDGPHVGQKKCTLPTTFAFSLIFKSSHAVRTVDLLALDDQTFRCWHLVFSYLAAVNNLDDGGAGGSTSGGADGVESLAPDPDSPATYGTPPQQAS